MTLERGATETTETWSRPPAWTGLERLGVAIVLLIATALRYNDFTAAPRLSDNQDPLQFAWSGLTLITRHVPYSWEVLHSYHIDYLLLANGTSYKIVHPWLTHPPLLSFLTGGWVYLLGARNLTDVTDAMVRPVGISLGLVSLWLAYLLGRRILDRRAALLGVLLLAVTPGAVLMGREVETEALLAPLLLLGLLMVHRLQAEDGGRAATVTLLVCALLLPLTKITGLVLGAALATILLALGHWRLAAGVALVALAGLGLYFGYAALFDFRLFIAVLQEWSTHRHGVTAGIGFITDNAGLGGPLTDGWWHLGWLGAAALLLRERMGPRALLLTWPVVAYAAGIAVLGDASVMARYGWYRIVLYPLIYLAAGYVCWEVLRRPSLPGLLMVIVLGGASATELAVGNTPWQPDAFLLAAAVGLLVLPSGVVLWRRDSQFWRAAAVLGTAVSLGLIIVAGAATSLNLANVYHSL